MTRTFYVGLLALIAAVVAHAGSVPAAELLMFEDATCVWCRRWHAEIAPSYPLSPEGQQAPLRRLHIRDQGLTGATLDKPVTATPTFVLVEDGREIGRLVGYAGRDFFYPLLGELLERLPPPTPDPAPPRERSAAASRGACTL